MNLPVSNLSALNPAVTASRLAALAAAAILVLGAFSSRAQEMDHSMHAPMQEEVEQTPAEQTPETPTESSADPHAGHAMPPVPQAQQPEADHSTMDHSAMGHAMPPSEPQTDPVDHSTMDHGARQQGVQEIDHSTMGHDMQADSAAMDPDRPASAPPIEPIPPVTPADRLAAFPGVAGHTVHDDAIHSYWLLDHLEVWDANRGTGTGWEAMSWIGTDLDRIWLRSEGEHAAGRVESADIELLYGRAIAPWWDLLAGVRHDFGEGPSQTFVAIGVQGLAPYKFEVEATAYLGQSGQTAASLEAEYETLFTNRLILQWMAGAELYGKDDERRGIGSGLSTIEAGLRLRYEFTRQFAPYVGFVHEHAYGGTADFRRTEGEDIDDTHWVAGLRIWF